jgi:uncharacterized protein YcbX
MHLGTLSAIRRYPVKSLRGEVLERAEIWSGGVRGDRTQRLLVESGHARVGREYRGIEHDRLHLVDSVEAASTLASERGVTLRAERGENFYYSGAISLIVDRWLDDLSAHVGYAVEPERFRPNFVVSASDAFHGVEADLCGATLEIGDVTLRVSKPISRCVIITYHPAGEPADSRILRYVAQERDAKMGVYCDVVRTGTARSGDSVRLLAR